MLDVLTPRLCGLTLDLLVVTAATSDDPCCDSDSVAVGSSEELSNVSGIRFLRSRVWIFLDVIMRKERVAW